MSSSLIYFETDDQKEYKNIFLWHPKKVSVPSPGFSGPDSSCLWPTKLITPLSNPRVPFRWDPREQWHAPLPPARIIVVDVLLQQAKKERKKTQAFQNGTVVRVSTRKLNNFDTMCAVWPALREGLHLEGGYKHIVSLSEVLLRQPACLRAWGPGRDPQRVDSQATRDFQLTLWVWWTSFKTRKFPQFSEWKPAKDCRRVEIPGLETFDLRRFWR